MHTEPHRFPGPGWPPRLPSNNSLEALCPHTGRGQTPGPPVLGDFHPVLSALPVAPPHPQGEDQRKVLHASTAGEGRQPLRNTPELSRSASGHLPSRAAVLPGRPPGVLPSTSGLRERKSPYRVPASFPWGGRAPSPGPSSILSSNGKGNLRSSCKGPTPGTQARLTGNYIQDLSDTLNQDTTDVIDDIPNCGWKTNFFPTSMEHSGR